MISSNKRMNQMDDDKSAKRMKKECSYGENCYRLNPAHFREYSHRHLESILDNYSGADEYPIPERLSLQRSMIKDQLDIIMKKQLYQPQRPVQDNKINTNQKYEGAQSDFSSESQIADSSRSGSSHSKCPEVTKPTQNKDVKSSAIRMNENINQGRCSVSTSRSVASVPTSSGVGSVPTRRDADSASTSRNVTNKMEAPRTSAVNDKQENLMSNPTVRSKDADYRPMVPPSRRAEDYLNVVLPRGRMAAKHAASAPYYIFYTTITANPQTHHQPYSITFQEILDYSLGELKCSLQINFMVDVAWLLAQYYFAGYSAKKLTILYGDDSMPDLKNINEKKPHVNSHHVAMATPFGKHHTKMMILCYEDGSLRVVISTANLYVEDWENRTQGLWMSPSCPELPAGAMPFEGESPTAFKRSLLDYLNHYHLPQLAFYVERVKRCDFSAINVFLVASVPGSHFDAAWGLCRAGALLRQHCAVPAAQQPRWPLLAQASSIGSYGKEPKLWLTGDFLHYFTKIVNQPQILSPPPELKLIYPSEANVCQSHDGRAGGGCLPYGSDVHNKQTWLTNYLYQWRAGGSGRARAMPHMKSYARVAPDGARAAFFLLTSSNVSKAAWGAINKGNKALRLMSYEAGVLLLPKFVINEDFFPLEEGARNRLIIPYDIPPTKYTSSMNPWLMDSMYK